MANESTESAVVTPPAPEAPAPAPDNAQIAQRLDRIEKSLHTLATNRPAPAHTAEAEQESGAANKPLLALAFGFAGLKLGAFAAGKIGLIADMVRGFKRNGADGAVDVVATLFTFGSAGKGEAKHVLKYSILTATIGSVVGVVGGAVLGWARGDRIKNPGDLFIHPIDSMKKIFGPDPKKHPKPAAQPAPETPQQQNEGALISNPIHDGIVEHAAQREIA